MSEAERELLLFLAGAMMAEHLEWAPRPSHDEIRRRLEELINKVKSEVKK